HYALWQDGVQHRDLSVANLMLRPTEDRPVPILNDWDLSFLAKKSQNVGEHTVTIPFLAGDLLTPEYWKGEIEVLYRHDL
ncbi:hypothetical protein BDV93DRAFT_424020, partial [Ceratobasidium sp. AG-I]